MSVRLRLARGGTKKRPYYHLVAANRTRARDSKYLERIGSYNPMLNSKDPKRIIINIDRAKYWLSVGAKPSERVAIFLSQHGLVKIDKKTKAKHQTKQHLPRAKTLAKLEEAKKSAEAAASAAKAPAPEMAKTNTPETAKTDTPETAKTNTPKTAKTDTPETAKADTPETAKTDTPAPETAKTDTPETAKPDTAETATADTPETATTDTPETAKPDAAETTKTDETTSN
ncbi:MAG: 30S ribosomal protein S16 [Alphaproteobacteria bacterium]